MYGLVMLREYLDEILDGIKTFDARAYDTKKRGMIALIDTKKSKIIGLVDLVGVHTISAKEYCDWHTTGKWSGMQLKVKDMNVTYYAYDFENPRRLAMPIKVIKNKRTWVDIDDSVKSQFIIQNKLF